MDDFMLSNLRTSSEEWSARLISITTPLIMEGIKSIYNEAWNVCVENKETTKYLVTFQNLLSRIPKWNSVIIEEERKRIVERSGCNYLEDLIMCVHIIQLKILTCIRVGNKQKKIDISVPKLDMFIHKVYINVARKLYMNVYLFEDKKQITALQYQKNVREIEIIIQECILVTIRESIPTEAIIRAYMDENVEHEEEVIIEQIEDTVLSGGGGEHNTGNADTTTTKENADTATNEHANDHDDHTNDHNEHEKAEQSFVPTIMDLDDKPVITKISFNDYDETETQETIHAPKTLERLEELSTARLVQKKIEEQDENDNNRISIHDDDDLHLNELDFLDLDTSATPPASRPSTPPRPDDLMLNIAELP